MGMKERESSDIFTVFSVKSCAILVLVYEFNAGTYSIVKYFFASRWRETRVDFTNGALYADAAGKIRKSIF